MTLPLPTDQMTATPAATDPDADDFGRFCRTGDRAALLAVWQRSEPILVAICRRHCPLEADDALQDAALQVLAHAGSWTGRGTVRSWLVAVAANAARQRQRAWLRRQARQQSEAPLPLCADPDPVIAETAAAVASALADLPDTYRLPLIWRYLDGLEFRDIASACGLNEKACRRRVELGLQRLRRALQAQPGTQVGALMPTLAALGQLQSASSASGGSASAATTLATAPLPVTGTTTGLIAAWPVAAGLAVVGASLLTLALPLTGPRPTSPPPAAVAGEPAPAPTADATLSALLARRALAEFRHDTVAEAVAWFRPTRREAGLIVDLTQGFATRFLSLPRAERSLREVITAHCAAGGASWTIRGGRVIVQTPLTPAEIEAVSAGLDRAQEGAPDLATLTRLGSLDLWQTILRAAPTTPAELLTRRLRWLPTALTGVVWREDAATVAALAKALARTDLDSEARIQLLGQAAGAGAAPQVLEAVIATALRPAPAPAIDQPLSRAFSPERLAAVAVCQALGDPLVADGGLIARTWRTLDRTHGLAPQVLRAAFRRGVVSGADALTLARDQATPYSLRLAAADAVARWGAADAASAPGWQQLAHEPEASPAIALSCHAAWVTAAEGDAADLLDWPRPSDNNLYDWQSSYLNDLAAVTHRPLSLANFIRAVRSYTVREPYAVAAHLAPWLDVPAELPGDLTPGIAASLRTAAGDALVLNRPALSDPMTVLATGALRLPAGAERILAAKEQSQLAPYAWELSRDPRGLARLRGFLSDANPQTKQLAHHFCASDIEAWHLAMLDTQDLQTLKFACFAGLRGRFGSALERPMLSAGFMHAALDFYQSPASAKIWFGYDLGVGLASAPPCVAQAAARIWLQQLARTHGVTGGSWIGIGVATGGFDPDLLAFAAQTAETHADARVRMQAGLVASYFGPGDAAGRRFRERLASDIYPPARRLFTNSATGPRWDEAALAQARWLWLPVLPLELPATTAPTPLRSTRVFWGQQQARITIGEPSADGQQMAQVVIPHQPQDVTYTAVAGVTATGATLIDARGGTCSPGWIPESFIIEPDGSVRLSDEDGPWHDGTTSPPQPAAKEPIAPAAGGF